LLSPDTNGNLSSITVYARISASATANVSGNLTVADALHSSLNESIGTSGTVTPVTIPVTTVGLYDSSSSTFMLRDSNDSGFADEVCSYGAAKGGLLPIVGDWNGDGIQSIGLYDPTTSTFYLRNTNCLQGPDDKGYADTVFNFGPANAGDEPVVGNWDGIGGDGIGLFDPKSSTFYLRNSIGLQGPNDQGYADTVFNFGPANGAMLPLAGDWDGSGRDGIGLYNRFTSTFYLREATTLQGPSDKGYADTTLNYGASWMGLLPVAGDWNGDGRDGIGVYDQATATFLLRNALERQGPSDKGYADLTFSYGTPYAMVWPVAGDWTASSVVPSQSSDAGGTTGTHVTPAALSSISTFPTASVNVRVDATAQNDAGTNLAANGPVGGSMSVAGDTSVPSGNITQSGVVSARAVDQIDLAAVTDGIVGPQSLAGVTDDLVSGTLAADSSRTDAALASI
jgi:hypothetical protein